MIKLFCEQTKENRANEIINSLKIEEEILAIYPYGSRVYGTASENSDYDYIVVTKGAFLKSGAFKQNAISSDDRKIQAVLYSRTGFIDALNNYEMGAIECIFLDSSQVLLSKWPFRIQKWDTKEMADKVIQKASASWHIASRQSKDGFKAIAKKGIFHSLRILMFGLQLKEYQTIYNYSEANELKTEIDRIPEDMFDDRTYLSLRDELIQKLRK
jgi:predicted nucleotidyltransferase